MRFLKIISQIPFIPIKRAEWYFFALFLFFVSCAGPVNPAAQIAASANANEEIISSFVAFGDWGDGSTGQFNTATALEQFCQVNTCDFVLTLGDNIYVNGVESTSDPLWQSRFVDVYGDLGIPFRVCGGNHDAYGNFQAEIDYSQVNSQWIFPAGNYSFTLPENSSTPVVDFFVIHNYDFSKENSLWLDEAIKSSKAKWKFLVMHYPFISNAGRLGERQRNDPLTLTPTCNKMDLFISGHDHLFTHLKGSRGGCVMDQLIIGTGGEAPEIPNIPDDPRVLDTQSSNGFGYFVVRQSLITFEFIDVNGNVLYQTSWAKN